MSMFYCYWCENHRDADYSGCYEDPNPDHPKFSLVCEDCYGEHIMCAECGEGRWPVHPSPIDAGCNVCSECLDALNERRRL